MKLRIMRKQTDNDGVHLTVTGEMTVYSAVKLKDVLMRELASCSGITLNLAGVHDADTSGFQLLVFLKNEARRLGKNFKISELSDRFESIFSLYREKI